MLASSRRPVSLFIVGLMMVAAFYLRSEMVSETVVISPIRADAKDYYMYAHNLTHHGIYSRDIRGLARDYLEIEPDAVRSPGYPLYLSVFMGSESLGAFLGSVLYSQALISTLTVGIAFLVFRCFLNFFCSLLAAVFTALSPHLVVANTYLLTETLFCFFLVVSGWWVSRAALKPCWVRTGILGGLLGVAYLIRPSILIFPLVIALFLRSVFPGRVTVKSVTAVFIGFLLVAAPWFGRNLVSLNQFSDNTLQVAFLHHGIYPDFMYNQQEATYGFPYRFDPRSAEISRSTGAVIREIKERFATAPVEHAIWYFFKKPIAFWSWNMVQGQGDAFVYPVSRTPYMNDPAFVWSHKVMRWLHYPLVWMGLLGCIFAYLPGTSRQLSPQALAVARFVSLLLLFFTGMHILGAPFPRYSIPLRPLIFGMAIFAGKFVWDHMRNRQKWLRLSISDTGA